MARPRDVEFEQKVCQWYYANGENQGLTAKQFGIHRSTVGRWISEIEGTRKYANERGITKNRYSDLEYGRFSMWIPIDDMAKLLKIATKNNISVSKLVVEVTADYLGVDFDG